MTEQNPETEVPLKKYRASVTRTFVGTFIVEAADEDDAWDVAEKMIEDSLDVQDILEGGFSWVSEELVDVEEVKEDIG